MMKMLKLLGLTVFVVCIAAFASGCGGGGGGSSMDTETPTAPTEPTTPAEPQTPEPTIADIRSTVLGILTSASGLADTAGASATAIGGSEDVTDAQLSLAVTWHQNARTALSEIVAANNRATSATTLEEAQQALSAAQTALTSLQTAQTQLASIQADLAPVVATPPTTPPTTPTPGATAGTFTNNSSLIEHLRDNKVISAAALSGLAMTSIADVGQTVTANMAVHPYYEDPNATPKVTGTRTVTADGISSSTRTNQLSGSGVLRYGYDLHARNATGDITKYANAYTDIDRATQRRAPADSGRDFDYIANPDYLVAGIWLEGNVLKAFAYGSEPIVDTPDPAKNFCTASDNSTSGTITKTCAETTGFHLISNFVDANKHVEATYNGNATGTHITDGKASYFDADVEIKAQFANDNEVGSKWVEGKIYKINAGGNPVTGEITLDRQTLEDNIGASFMGEAAGTIDGSDAYTGEWKGQFFGLKAQRPTTTQGTPANDGSRTDTITYAPAHPGSVAGTFYVIRRPKDDAAFIGAFGAHR